MRAAAASAAAFTTSVSTFRFPTRRNLVSLGSFSAAICCSRGCRTITCSQSSSLPDEGKKQQPWLIVGLGNPGRKYEGTRHNIPFIEKIVSGMSPRHGAPPHCCRVEAIERREYLK